MKKFRAKRAKRAPPVSRVPRIRGPIPNAIIVHLPWTRAKTQASVAAGGGGFALTNLYHTNSIWDPENTGASPNHQPRYHDQWALMYKRYYVRKCKVTYRVHLTGENNVSGGYILTEHRAANDVSKATVLNSVEDMLERVRASNGKIKLRRMASPVAGPTLWKSISMTVVPAFDLEGHDRTTNAAVMGTNPANLTMANMIMWFNQATVSAVFYVEVSMDYEVILMDPIMPLTS